MRQILAIGLVSIGLITAFLVGSQVPNIGLAQATTDSATERTITVTGTGAVNAAPDALNANIGVVSINESLDEALSENNQKMADIIALLQSLGIEDRDIQTSNFNISMEREDFNGPFTGYRVSNTVSVLIRDLDAAGTTLDQVVAAGANEIFGIQFTITDRSEFDSQARSLAVADALSKADELVTAAGAQLGQVITISSFDSSPSFSESRAFDMATSGASVPLQGGELQILATVQVTLAIE